MTKTEQLFIRACKARKPLTRVESVYRRFYLERDDPHPHIAIILARLCDKFSPFTTTNFITELSPGNNWRYGGEDDSFELQCIHRLVSKLRFTEATKLVGMTVPLAFRKK